MWIEKNQEAAGGLAARLDTVTSSMGGVKSSALQAMSSISSTLAQAANIPSQVAPTTIAASSAVLPNYQEAISQATKPVAAPEPVAAQTTTTRTVSRSSEPSQAFSTAPRVTVNNNFVGQNIIDESTKDRYAREVTDTVRGFSTNVIRAN